MVDLPNDLVLDSEIPPVTELCRALGFGGNTYGRSFWQSIISWLKEYETDSGSCGTDFSNWESDKFHLGVMAVKYLEENSYENAYRYWSYNSVQGELCYPSDQLG